MFTLRHLIGPVLVFNHLMWNWADRKVRICWKTNYIKLYLQNIVNSNVSSPSGQPGSYTGLIGFNPRRLQGPKRGMSSHTMDLSVYAKSSSSSSSRLAQDSGFTVWLSIVILMALVQNWGFRNPNSTVLLMLKSWRHTESRVVHFCFYICSSFKCWDFCWAVHWFDAVYVCVSV